MMTRRRLSLLAAALIVCLPLMPGVAIAQASDLAARQASGLGRVSGVAGDWRLAKFQWDKQRNDWSVAPSDADAGGVSFHLMDHGKAFRATFRLPQFAVDGFLSYDVWTERYVLVSLDDQIGQIDVQQGAFAEDRLILDNLKADTTYKVRQLPTHTRLELRFEAGQLYEIQVDSSQDQGKSWKPTSRYRVRRAHTGE